MVELFTIFGKGGLVLCFQEGKETFTDAVNELIAGLSTVVIQQRTVAE